MSIHVHRDSYKGVRSTPCLSRANPALFFLGPNHWECCLFMYLTVIVMCLVRLVMLLPVSTSVCDAAEKAVMIIDT